MTQKKAIDGMLQEWGTRLFYGMPKKGKRLRDGALLTPAGVRTQVRAVVRPQAKEVMVKITGGGAGMKAVAAHFRYISRQGKPEVGGRGQSLELEDEHGNKISGAEAIKDLQYDWRMAGSYIPDESHRREVFNIMLSMPEGTPPAAVRDAARAFAQETFEGHRYVFVMHEDTKSPHVHLAVRAERSDGVRLNPRKADLRRWRERFASRLQDRGVNAVATHAWTRGAKRAPQALWRVKAQEHGTLHKPRPVQRSPVSVEEGRRNAIEAWGELAKALATSPEKVDRELAIDVVRYVGEQFRPPELQKDRSPGRGDIESNR
jgi:hypothetical protein